MHRICFIFILFLLVSSQAFAQDIRLTDFELWLKAGGKVKIGEKWRLAFEEQIRFDENISEHKNFHTEIDLRYELSEHFDLHFVNRFITRNDNQGATQGFEQLYRFQLGGTYSHRAGQWRFKHRLLYQNRNEMGVKTRDGDIPEKFLRIRSAFEYKIKKWKYDPQFRIEYFSPINEVEAGTISQLRFGFGTERKYDKLGEFGLFFLLDRSSINDVTFIDQILFLKYTYAF